MAERATRPIAVFGYLCVLAAAVVVAAIWWTKTRAGASDSVLVMPQQELPAALGSGGAVTPKRVYFRHNGLGAHFGKLAHVDYRGQSPTITFVDGLSCEAVYVAAGRGVCLSASRGVVTTYSAKLFDSTTHEVAHVLSLAGVPSRTRVSADGAVAAATVFVTGHGYDSVDFTTQTLLLDLLKGEVIADLETFTVFENGREISRPDFNFWGVTFAPDNVHFFATLSTNRQHFLVKGNRAEQTVEVLRDNVECPSVSPDGTRVAYKRRFETGGRISWQLHVLNLATGQDTALAEHRSVDDQLEWLDNDHVLYSVAAATTGSAATDVWVAAADGSGTPAVFLQDAYSPAVVP